jgi:hypothetical protein
VRMQSIHSKRDAANWASEYMIIESVFGLAARRTKASKRANWLGRAGEAKTNWTKPPAPS